MSAKQQNRIIITLARQGRLEGDTGLRCVLNEAMKLNLDIDFSEKPYFRSALWEATWKNHEVIVKLLVDKGATVAFTDYQLRTPLHEAAYYGHLNLVEYFLEKGHPIDCCDAFHQTPLFRAVDGGRHDVVKYLVIKKAQTNLLDSHEVTVQHLGAFGGMPQMADWLVYNGAWKNRFMHDDKDKREKMLAAARGAIENPEIEDVKVDEDESTRVSTIG